jgi:hypothetical protein
MKILVATVLMVTAIQAFAFDAEALTRSNRELAAHEAQKPAWKVQQDAEDAEIKMRSFDQATVGRTAYIFATPIDEKTPRAAMVAILYRDTPCPLPLSHAKDMRAAESLYGRGLAPACWGKLVTPTKDEVVIVTKFGDSRRESLLNYAETKIQPDGSALLVRPAMSREEFTKNVADHQKAMR